MTEPLREELARLYPPRDRRRRKRVVTLRNARWFALGVVALFVLISIFFEFSGRQEPGEFGRLYARRTRGFDVQPRKPYTVVKERSVRDSTGADPLLLDAARRAQYLGVTDADLARMRPKPAAPTDTGGVIIPGGDQPLLGQSDSTNQEKARFEITGGPEGVQVRTDTDPPQQ